MSYEDDFKESSKMSNIINDDEAERANGLLFVIYIFLVSFNVLIIAFMGFSLSWMSAKYMILLKQYWIKNVYFIENIITAVLMILSIIIGLNIYKMKKTAWHIFKFYIIFQQIYFTALIMAAYNIISKAHSLNLVNDKNIRYENIIKDLIFRLVSSLIIYGLLAVYSLISKQAELSFNKTLK